MRDIWAVLLQTLTASGVAVLLLAVKAMFRDKLPPRWQFAAWGVLGLVLLLPAGAMGRYVLVDWPLLLEWAKVEWAGAYGLTRVTAPVPLPPVNLPQTVFDWLFVIYAAGVVCMALRYLFACIRLRRALGQGTPAGQARMAQVAAVARRYGLPVCSRVVEVAQLPSAFVFGVFRPVLVMPAGVPVDDKVILHELLHLKHHDVCWGLVICLFRCIHWCNPLLAFCANQAGNDLESLCDQRVLEQLEGEERRDYGHILLSMANEQYARAPGTSSIANGGANISRRIQAIARFKRYPAGMGLVSVCVLVVLAAPMLLGTRIHTIVDNHRLELSLASARAVGCTTPAGALDAYGKALLSQSGICRAMCAPMSMQRELTQLLCARGGPRGGAWQTGLPAPARSDGGYCLYNLEMVDGGYEALLAVQLADHGQPSSAGEEEMLLAVQRVRAEPEQDRWVVRPQGSFRQVRTQEELLERGCMDLPAYTYRGTAGDFQVEVRYQRSFVVESAPETSGRRTPQPDAQFETVGRNSWISCTYVGPEENKDAITHLGLSVAPMEAGEPRPTLTCAAGEGEQSGSSNTGSLWASRSLSKGWQNVQPFGGGGSSGDYDPEKSLRPPDCFVADLYINRNRAAELTLERSEGGAV